MLDLLKNIHWNGKTFGYDLLMINDHQRNQFYAAGLQDVAGKVVLDIGAGTGLLSAMAVQAGAKLVYAFEYDPQNYATTKQFLERAGLTDRIKLICADVLSVDKHTWPHEPIDMIITETFANDCFVENFAFLVSHVENNFNLAPQHRWIPDKIDLSVAQIDIEPTNEFDPGVELPDDYVGQINQAIQIYKNNFYHKHSQINIPVGLVPKIQPELSQFVDSFVVDNTLKQKLDSSCYWLNMDWSTYKNPYLKVDWILHSQHSKINLNQCVSWRSIGFVVDQHKGSKIYLRFHPLTHALLATQI